MAWMTSAKPCRMPRPSGALKSAGGRPLPGCLPRADQTPPLPCTAQHRGHDVTTPILLTGGDGIGPEVLAEARKVLAAADRHIGGGLPYAQSLIVAAAIDGPGVALPQLCP